MPPSLYPRDRLQPSLFDRLEDQLGSSIRRLAESRERLDRLLSANQRAALDALFADERFATRSLQPAELAPFNGLDAESRELAERVVDLERARQQELRRSFVISTRELRRCVLRDLQNLLNTTCLEPEVVLEGPEDADPLAGLAAVRASVVNYGIPGLAGRVRTAEDFGGLASAIEAAILAFEPRIRAVRVRTADAREGSAAELKSPVVFIIEGELWGYPFAEQLQVRTFVDLDIGRIELAEPVGVS